MRYEFFPISCCEMCGSSDFKVMGLRLNRSQGKSPRRVTGIAVGVKRCERCQLIFSDPRPRPTDLADHYGVPPESYWTRPAQWDVAEEHFSSEIAEARQLLGDRPHIVSLDIGAGLGKAMRAMARAGFDAHGIEPSATFRDKCLELTGIAADRLQLASVEDAVFADASFDFISFGASLEHIQEPGRAIEKAMRWLKPGGVLHAEVPSSNYVLSDIINGYFRLRGVNYVTNLSPMHAPYHLYEFGLESFREHGRRTGYELAAHHFHLWGLPRLPTPVQWLLRKWMSRTDSGMQLTVWLRRTEPEHPSS